MKPAPFEYQAVASVQLALERLEELGDEAKPLAGGQSLLPLMALRLARPCWLLDLNPIPELRTLELDGDIRIGSMVLQRTIERSQDVRASVPLLAEAVSLIGHPQIRNRGTIGGSLTHADPAAELPAVVCALEAQLVAESVSGSRVIPAGEFFRGYFETALRPDELLTTIVLRRTPPFTGTAYEEFSRRKGDFAVVGVAAVVTLDSRQRRRITRSRLVIAGVGPTATRAVAAEDLLVGHEATPEVWRAAGQEAAREIDPSNDLHGPAGYRRHLTGVLVERALAKASGRGQGRG